ncbi:MAG TPA: ABC transporter substrate-binding protein [Methylomirabilota bacterium]|nr:ABC transporter substrate-binding protein [Methylomirabilota bacterium]
MRRRAFVTMLGGAAASWATVTSAQPRVRLGYLSGGSKGDNEENSVAILKESLRRLGWRLGETLEIEERWASGDFARLPRLAQELVAGRPDILVSTGQTETRTLQAVAGAIPIIFMQVSVDPVIAGFVKQIARPGGNITGFMQSPHFLWGKRIELLTELLGRPPRRLAWIGNPGNTGSEANWADARDAAAKVGSEVIRVNVSTVGDLDRAFDALKSRDALLVQFDFLLAVQKQRVAAHVARVRLPAIYENRSQATAGGLMSYGGDLRENYRQGAQYVHRVLNGTPPGDLPVVQASRFELVLNVKTARALGLTVPDALLARADEVIE